MKAIIFDADIVRLFYNKDLDLKKCWSLDFGRDTAEILLTTVILDNIGGTTEFFPEGDNTDTPKALLVFPNARVNILGLRAIIGQTGEPNTVPAAAGNGILFDRASSIHQVYRPNSHNFRNSLVDQDFEPL